MHRGLIFTSLILALTFWLPHPSQAQSEEGGKVGEVDTAEAKGKGTSIDSSRQIQIRYGYPQWNTDSARIDSASVILRDGKSGRVVQVALEETEPDSSLFSGVFSIGWGKIDQIQAEFYIPPQDLLRSPEGIKKLERLIRSRKLTRKPFIIRRQPNMQVVEIFDTRKEAVASLEAYKKEASLKKQDPTIRRQEGAEGVQERSILDPAQALEAQKAAELARLQAEQIRLEQIERQKAKERLEAQRAMKAEEIRRRKAQAAEFAKQAMDHYAKGEFKEAAELFSKSVELDPGATNYYLQYGISLYRLDEFKKSLAILNVAEGEGVNQQERAFYVGLNQYRLESYDEALKSFRAAKAGNDKILAPSASFYEGVILMQKKDYEPAQEALQYVLNNSQDPKLDERAEQLIEQIIRIRAYEASQARRWLLSGNIGFIYDSNIIFASNSARDQGTAQGEGVRLLTQASGAWRPLNTEEREFSARLSFLNMISRTTSFEENRDLEMADPTMATLALPYVVKTRWGERPYRIEVTPGYEVLYMAIESESNEMILRSPLLSLSNTLIMNENWYQNFNLILRYDESLLESSVGENDSTAMKSRLVYSHVIFLDKAEGELLLPEASYTINAAEGESAKYYRLDLGVGYMTKWKWDLIWNARLAYYVANYPDSASAGEAARADQNYSLSTGFSRKLGEHWTGILNLNYTVNSSNQDSSEYDKFSALTSFAFNY